MKIRYRGPVLAASVLLAVSVPASAQFGFFSSDSSQEAKASPSKVTSDGCPSSLSEFLKTKPMKASELLGELRNLKNGFSGGNPVASLESMLGGKPIKPSAASVQKPSPTNAAPKYADKCTNLLTADNVNAVGGMFSALTGGGMFSGVASSATDMLLDALLAEISYAAIEKFLTLVIEKPDVLSQITVDVPEVSNFSPELRKQTLNIAAYLAAIKASNLMVQSAEIDFEAAKKDYHKIMQRREKAAEHLMNAILSRDQLKEAVAIQKAKKGTPWISDKDLEYATKLLEADRKAFFTDFNVQRIALEYMRSQPEFKAEISEFSAEQSAFVNSYGAYARTTAGLASMVGFSGAFIKGVKGLWEKQGPIAGAVLGPVVIDAGKEVGKLAYNVRDVFKASDKVHKGSFAIFKDGERLKSNEDFQQAVSRMDETSQQLFKDNLLRNDRSGYVSVLYQRAKDSATGMADRLVPKDEKVKLAETFGIDNPNVFSFNNVLSDKYTLGKTKKAKIATAFQSKVKPGRSDPEAELLLSIQNSLINQAGKLSNGEARRIMFAMAESGTGGSWLDIGNYRISIDSPGMEGLRDQIEFFSQKAMHATTRRQK